MILLTDLVQTIKKAAIEAVEAGEPAAPFIGTVTRGSPLRVRLNQRLSLSGERILFMRGQAPPEEGDRLALLRFGGGQTYLVLGYL